MNSSIITQPMPKNQPLAPRRGRVLPDKNDPYRRLAAAILLSAVKDHLWPPRSLSLTHRQSAALFLASKDAVFYIEFLDLSLDRVRCQLAMAAAAQPEVAS